MVNYSCGSEKPVTQIPESLNILVKSSSDDHPLTFENQDV